MDVAFMDVSVWVKGGEGVKGEGLVLVPTVCVYYFMCILYFYFQKLWK